VSLKLFILDACVLIDFVTTDSSILRLACLHVGEVHIAAPVLDEVDQLDESGAVSLGIRVVQPSLPTAMAAASRRGALSFQDWLCVLMAKEHGWTCISNDGRLRRECAAENVPVMWGLELLERIMTAGALDAEGAIAAAWAIHASNPRYVTKAIVQAFERKISRVSR
jgi:hypothetical protein